MKTKEDLHRITLKRGLRPIPKVSVSDWADRYRVVSAGNAEPGRWRTSRVPYMRAVMDAFTEATVERVVVKSAAQVGKTEVLLNVIGRYAHVDPCTMLLINPTLEMSTDFSKARLSKMIADTKVLTPLFYGEKSQSATRDANQTLLSKFFTGGRIVLAGANSPAGLASRPIRILLCDEVDRFPPSAGAEGDPLSIAAKRTSTFWNRKIGLFSTPTVQGFSRIDVEYELGTQEHWAHRCPCCGEYHTIEYNQIEDDNRWHCPDCGYAFDELSIKSSDQKYLVDNPDASGCRSFFIPGFYSPWVSWAEIMREWREARGKPDLERVVYNTRFGRSYEQTGEISDSDRFGRRLEEYGAEIPEGVRYLTAGVDVQADRLEYEIVGWGEGEESWGIVRGKIYCEPNDPRAWTELDDVLDREYRSKTSAFKVMRTFVDSGFMTSTVYEYCRRRARSGRFAIKGVGSCGKQLIWRTSMKDGVPLILLGVNEGKQEVYSRLMLTEPGARYFHFGADDRHIRCRGYDEEYFRGLTAEHKVRRQTGGLIYEQWEPVNRRVRNEPLDLRVYALAAMKTYEERPKKKAVKTWEMNIW